MQAHMCWTRQRGVCMMPCVYCSKPYKTPVSSMGVATLKCKWPRYSSLFFFFFRLTRYSCHGSASTMSLAVYMLYSRLQLVLGVMLTANALYVFVIENGLSLNQLKIQ